LDRVEPNLVGNTDPVAKVPHWMFREETHQS
jgi:hypothetical protein